MDVCVANAGGPPAKPFAETTIEDWQTAVNLNFMSTLYFAREALPLMQKQKWGRLIAITSISAKQPMDGLILSNAVRAGVTGLVKSLSNEYARDNVLVNNICPGYTRTERVEQLADSTAAKEGITPREVVSRFENQIPMRRLGLLSEPEMHERLRYMALDEKVLREQAEMARHRIEHDSSISTQRRLNFEMSVKNLLQSLEDRERVPKIQGLLNECMTFLDDELSVITGPYEDLLSIDDVIEQELILFVTLNVNKNTEPVRALGKMLLQNLQLVVGKRYESEEQRRKTDRPLFSVVLDEFAPFGYRNFAQILQTARGTKTAFLFSMQSLPQLMQVGRGFKEDVTSAPNTTIILRTRDEETARYFIRASAQETVSKRTYNLAQHRVFVHEWYEKTGAAMEREDKEYRAKDLDVKTLPKGQMQILMTDDARGVLHSRLHVRAPEEIRVPCFEPELYPRLRHSVAESQGANLRFKNPEIAAKVRQPRRQKFGAKP